MSDQIGQAMIYALMLILPLSALAARRLPIGTTMKYALAWAAIFAAAMLIVAIYQRLTAAGTGGFEDDLGSHAPPSRHVAVLHNADYRLIR